MNFIDGTEEPVYFDDGKATRKVGVIGRDQDMNFGGPKRVFDWNQNKLEMESTPSQPAYGLSKQLFKILHGKDVEFIHVDGDYIDLTRVKSSYELIDPANDDRFDDTSLDPQYVIRP